MSDNPTVLSMRPSPAHPSSTNPRSNAESLLDRYLRKPADAKHADTKSATSSTHLTHDPHDDESDTPQDLGCFGYLRGLRDRALMLELHKKDGSVTAIAYAYIEIITYSPDPPHDGITLHAAGMKIRISGTNLNTKPDAAGISLLSALTRHRVPWVKEASQSNDMNRSDDQPCVDAITE